MAATQQGVTLAELLITFAVLAIVAAVMIPSVSFNDANRLTVAGEAVGNALRFARSEAIRSGANILVDAETVPGHLRLATGGCATATGAPAVLDPQTRRAYDAAIRDGTFSSGVVLTPRFLAGGTPWAGLVFDSTGAAVQACSVASQTARGSPQQGSGVDLTFAGQKLTIAIDPPTGRITGF